MGALERLIDWYGNHAVRLTRAGGCRSTIGYLMTLVALVPLLLLVALFVLFGKDKRK